MFIENKMLKIGEFGCLKTSLHDFKAILSGFYKYVY